MQIVELGIHNSRILQNVAEDVFDYPIDPIQTEAFLNCPRHLMVLAVENETVIGMASGVEYFHPDKPPQLWINEVSVTAARRSQGIGRRLVEALIDKGKRRGCVYAWLGTERGNLPAQRCFGSVPNGKDTTDFLLYEWKFADPAGIKDG